MRRIRLKLLKLGSPHPNHGPDSRFRVGLNWIPIAIHSMGVCPSNFLREWSSRPILVLSGLVGTGNLIFTVWRVDAGEQLIPSKLSCFYLFPKEPAISVCGPNSIVQLCFSDDCGPHGFLNDSPFQFQQCLG